MNLNRFSSSRCLLTAQKNVSSHLLSQVRRPFQRLAAWEFLVNPGLDTSNGEEVDHRELHQQETPNSVWGEIQEVRAGTATKRMSSRHRNQCLCCRGT